MEDKNLLRLVRRARRGDRDSFCKLIEAKTKDILYIATNLMGNSADGEDAAQEAVLLIARNIEKLKRVETFNSWMYRIIFSVCMEEKSRKSNVMRSKSLEFEKVEELIREVDSSVLPEPSYDLAVRNKTLAAAIGELPESYRMCIVLFYYEGLSYEEIAHTMDLSYDGVANLLRRAKKKLQDILEQDAQGSLSVKGGALLSTAALSEAIHADTEASVTEEMAARLGAAAQLAPLNGNAMHAAAAALLALLPAPKTVLACAAVIAVLVTGAGVVHLVENSGGSTTALEAPADEAPTSETPTAAPAASAKETAAMPESLLGPDEAAALENYAETTVDRTSWNSFAARNGLSMGARIVTNEYFYTVYFKEDDENNLTVIERRDNAGGTVLAYGMCPPGTKPQDDAIIDAFDAWRAG